MFVVQISLLIVKFLSYIMIFVINTNHQRSQPTLSHGVNVWSVTFFLLLFLLLMPFVECWCAHMLHCMGRPSGVDHTNGGERIINSNSIVSHATLIL